MTFQELNNLIAAARRRSIYCENYSKDDNPKYSGRGMYGKQTHAITVDCADDLHEIEKLSDKLGIDVRIDNLGLGYIVY